MTTIIAINTADDQAIYCDSLVQHGSIAVPGNSKYFSIPGLLAAGSCGSQNGARKVETVISDICGSGQLAAFFDHPGRQDGLKMSEYDQLNFEMLLLYGGEIWLLSEDLTPIQVLLPYMAKGSGGHFALGALAAGATPWQALAIASHYDIGTGGPFFRCNIEGKIACFPSLLVE